MIIFLGKKKYKVDLCFQFNMKSIPSFKCHDVLRDKSSGSHVAPDETLTISWGHSLYSSFMWLIFFEQ